MNLNIHKKKLKHMIAKKGNNIFLERINILLGKRKKHVWGREIGLKSTRINAIFEGKIPGSDALIIISRAEKVRIDWLTGLDDKAPYQTQSHLSDEETAEKIKAMVARSYEPVLLLDEIGGACVVLEKPMLLEYDDGTESRFIDVEIFPNIGPASVETLEQVNAHYSLVLRSDMLQKIAEGYVSPHELLTSDKLLKRRERVQRIGDIREKVSEYKLENSSTADLIRRAGQLKMSEQEGNLLYELFTLLDVFRYLEPAALAELMDTARNLAAQQLENDYSAASEKNSA